MPRSTGRGRDGGRRTGAPSRGSASAPGPREGLRPRRRGAPEQGATVAGYRLVRLIGRGARAEVYLAHPMQEAGRTGRGEGAGNVAVKIVPPTERSRGDAEALALQSVASEHVVGLRDVASLADGSLCIVQSLAARGTAAGLLARRGGLTPGEIVTLVASILRGLGDMHDAGIAHGALDLTHVLIDATGCPVLGGLGSACPFDGDPAGESPRGADPVEQDLIRVARIVAALRDPVGSRGSASDDRWGEWLDLLDATVHGETDLTAHDLADQLLEVADAAPLAEAGTVDTAPTTALGRTRQEADDEAAGPEPRSRRARRTSRAHPGTARRHRAVREDGRGSTAARIRGARSAVRRELAVVRPRVWALGLVALVAVSAGAVALPMLAGAARGESVDATAPGSAGEGTDADASAAEPPSSSEHEHDHDLVADAAMAGSEDPDVAAPALLRLRADCLRRRDARCLDGVDQAGSAADDADRSRVSGPTGGWLDDGEAHLADAIGPARLLGDSALLELSPIDDGTAVGVAGPSSPGRRTASLLMVRGEAGWRIRDLMDDR
ncbi:protein kinase domain-containing protein [Clavibacter zhangzhiyongii]|uniref:protein kinase domain-containing protein n=1 Tax=Clavibacter zhangzhiyongii TaxID=2768071 RepID=UPI003CC82CA5